MATTYIQRVDSTDGNRKVWTWSAWVKRDVLGSVDAVIILFVDLPAVPSGFSILTK